MAVRQVSKAVVSLLTKHGVGAICANKSNINTRLLASFCGISSSNFIRLYVEPRKYIGINLASNSFNIDRRTLSTPQLAGVNMMGSILVHQKYKEMKSKLSKRNRKSLGPLDTASLYILSSKDLTVNLEILRLDALSPQSHNCPSKKGFQNRPIFV